jgi:alpha-1,6-mannosyltransferase
MAFRACIEALPFLVMALMVFVAPHVKVEESFNAQLIHDLLYAGGSMAPYVERPDAAAAAVIIDVEQTEVATVHGGLRSFDHHSFPGVVPRTSIGAWIVAAIAAAPVRLLDAWHAGTTHDRTYALIVARLVLGSLVCASIVLLCRSVSRLQLRGATRGRRRKDKADSDDVRIPLLSDAGVWTVLIITLCSFHTMYYASRPLPNTFALALVNVAAAAILRGKPHSGIATLAFAATVFRSDVAVLAGPICLVLVLTRQVGVVSGAATGLAAAALSIGISVLVDSIVWGHATWPEGVVFYYNTVLNKSHEWGVMSWHWYFTSALPRCMSFGLPLMLLNYIVRFEAAKGLRPILYMTSCFIVFVGLYSFLPHKEVRFILIGVPLGLTSAGCVAASAWSRLPLRIALMCFLTAASALSALMLLLNSHEYVGARSIATVNDVIKFQVEKGIYARQQRLRQAKSSELVVGDDGASRITVYLDAYACMNGITRFEKLVAAEGSPAVRYTKDPALLNKTRYTEEDTHVPYDVLAGLDWFVVRKEDAAWLMAEANRVGIELQLVDQVPKIAVSARLPRSMEDLMSPVASGLVTANQTPFLVIVWRK